MATTNSQGAVATVVFFKEAQVKSLAWIRTEDISLISQEATPHSWKGTRFVMALGWLIYIVRLIYFRDVCFTQKGFEFPFMSFLNTKLVSSLSSLIFFCKTIYVNATLQDATLQDEKECVYLYKRSRDNAVKKKDQEITNRDLHQWKGYPNFLDS